MAESPAGEYQHDPNKLEQYNIHKLHGKLKASPLMTQRSRRTSGVCSFL